MNDELGGLDLDIAGLDNDKVVACTECAKNPGLLLSAIAFPSFWSSKNSFTIQGVHVHPSHLPANARDIVQSYTDHMLKLHWFDLLWIFSQTTAELVLEIHNKSDQWRLSLTVIVSTEVLGYFLEYIRTFYRATLC